MYKLKICLTGIVLFGIILACGCRPPRSTDPHAGFSLTLDVTQGGVGFPFPVLANITASTFASPQGTTGSIRFFPLLFTNHQTVRITDAVVPAEWRFQVGGAPGTCFGLQQYVRLDARIFIGCNVSFAELFVSPSMINAPHPGNTLTLSGQSLASSSTLPRIIWYNEFGQVVFVAQSVSSSSAKGSIESPMPNMTNWTNGHYLVLASSSDNPTESTVIGSAIVTVYGNINPPDPDDPPNPCLSQQPNPCLY